MDFRLTPKQKAVKEMSRRFAREVIAPWAEEFERQVNTPMT